MRLKTVVILTTVLVFSTINSAKGQSNWPQFRGPNGLGISSETKKLGYLLCEKSYLDQGQLDHALTQQQQNHW